MHTPGRLVEGSGSTVDPGPLAGCWLPAACGSRVTLGLARSASGPPTPVFDCMVSGGAITHPERSAHCCSGASFVLHCTAAGWPVPLR